MNREQKAAAIAEIAAQMEESHAIFAVDYRGISVPQVAELRGRLRDADATFKVVKNSLTERAADQAGADSLKDHLTGPTALTFVRGDVATAAKAIADYGRATQLLQFKGGLMDGAALDVEELRTLSRLPSRDVLYGQLVGVVASPVRGLVTSLGALIGGLAAALGQVREKKQSGEIPAAPDEAPAQTPELPVAEASADDAASTAAEVAALEESGEESPGEPASSAEDSEQAGEAAPEPEPAGEAETQAEPENETAQETEPAGEADTDAESANEAAQEAEPAKEAESAESESGPDQEPAQENDDQAEASAEAPHGGAEEKPAKED